MLSKITFCQDTKHTISYSIVAIILIDLCHAPQIISEMLSQIHTMENCDFLIPIIHSQII